MKKKTLIEIIGILIGIGAIIAIAVLVPKKPLAPTNPDQNGNSLATDNGTITISEEEIKEEYYTVKKPVIQGSGILATTAQNYVTTTVQAFADAANAEVPERIKEFGEGNPSTNYGLELSAKEVTSKATRSIVLNGYDYRGGANGQSFYKTFTEFTASRNLIILDDVIAPEQQRDFVTFVKQKLLAMQDRGVFAQSVESLTFASFDRWSFDQDGALTIYFDRSEIAAGAAGAIDLKLAKSDVEKFVKVEYK